MTKSIEAPPLDARDAAQVVADVEEALQESCAWQGQDGGAGRALVHLFGRLAELVINRLNRVPDKHFLAFLNEAGVDLLPPRPACTEVAFKLADDGPYLVRVPAGTQVATVQTETQPEVVFETQRDVVIVPNALVKCVAFDPLSSADRTTQTAGREGVSFAAFQGEGERERVFYIGDDALFAFPDEATRLGTTVELQFTVVDQAASPPVDWQLEWEYYDEDKACWVSFVHQPDTTLLENGADDLLRVAFASPPPLGQCVVTDGKQEWDSRWIRARLTGGTSRDVLPIVDTVRVRNVVSIEEKGNLVPDLCYYNPIESSAYIPLDLSKEFYPFGTRPHLHDTFYIAADEPLSKPGAIVTVSVEAEERDYSGPLSVCWEYYDGEKWQLVATSSPGEIGGASGIDGAGRVSVFSDDTQAFVVGGECSLTFTLPDDDGAGQRLPRLVVVNEQEHYWLRVRISTGSYGQEGCWNDTEKHWVPEQLYPPILKSLKLSYTYTPSSADPAPVAHCLGQVDMAYTSYASDSRNEGRVFMPFSAAEEGSALYLGFQKAFPAGEWMQVLLDVDDVQTLEDLPNVFWEYWNGSGWVALRVSDGSRGLSERGYLGFFGPNDHWASTEFGQEGYWLRARPSRLPMAGAQACASVSGTVELDSSTSEAFDNQAVAKYVWRLLSSTPPMADAGADRSVTAADGEATVRLDGSGSTTAEGRTIAKYIWRRVGAERPIETDERTPYLKAVRLNTVPAINAITFREEVLGSGDGKPDQVFTLLRSPVVSGAQIAVREPDRPPANELGRLQEELRQGDENAEVLLSEPGVGGGNGVWVRWHEVSDFHDSACDSRHFTLDLIGGEVRFGDGQRGKIPPVGSDNVKAVVYQTHSGAAGNVDAGSITVLRNPSGDLAEIKRATNFAAAAGGADAETVDEVKLRGPQSLKHRQRVVTVEDFAWLALEASGEVAQARCLPTRNSLGLPEAGWVTLVITPKSRDARPMPNPTLLRHVQNYLESYALANLSTAGSIHVKGPEYIEATVLAQVIPEEPEKADEVELAVLGRLETFLHPLWGGPERAGWDLGRSVYLSEVCAEIEAVSGVDHVAEVRLLGSLQQRRLLLSREGGAYRQITFDVPSGSQVGTFDERIKLLLAEQILLEEGQIKDLTQFVVYGFKVGDEVNIVVADNTVLVSNLTIASILGDGVMFDRSFEPSVGWAQRDALMSVDGRLRLPLLESAVSFNAEDKVVGVGLDGFVAGDMVSVVVGGRRDPVLEFLPIEGVALSEDRLFVPEGHLVYSGRHDIEMVLE